MRSPACLSPWCCIADWYCTIKRPSSGLYKMMTQEMCYFSVYSNVRHCRWSSHHSLHDKTLPKAFKKDGLTELNPQRSIKTFWPYISNVCKTCFDKTLLCHMGSCLHALLQESEKSETLQEYKETFQRWKDYQNSSPRTVFTGGFLLPSSGMMLNSK